MILIFSNMNISKMKKFQLDSNMSSETCDSRQIVIPNRPELEKQSSFIIDKYCIYE